MFGDDCFERSFFPESSREFRAKQVEMSFRLGFFEALGFEEAAKLTDLRTDSGDALRNRFELEGQLPALATEGFHLQVGISDFRLQASGFAIGARKALFGLGELVAKPRDRRNRVENRHARVFLLMFKL